MMLCRRGVSRLGGAARIEVVPNGLIWSLDRRGSAPGRALSSSGRPLTGASIPRFVWAFAIGDAQQEAGSAATPRFGEPSLSVIRDNPLHTSTPVLRWRVCRSVLATPEVLRATSCAGYRTTVGSGTCSAKSGVTRCIGIALR